MPPSRNNFQKSEMVSVLIDFSALSNLENITVEDMERNIAYVERTPKERIKARTEFIKTALEIGFK